MRWPAPPILSAAAGTPCTLCLPIGGDYFQLGCMLAALAFSMAVMALNDARLPKSGKTRLNDSFDHVPLGTIPLSISWLITHVVIVV